MSDTTEKLTKKQKKALEFRNKTKKGEDEPSKKRARDEDAKEEKVEAKVQEPVVDGEEPKKKRKTRRGKKGKGQGGTGPRFLLFVGNLPYNITETEIMAHFSAAGPDRIRIRSEKGIAFLEFDGSGNDIQRKMEVALRMHHSSLRNRKINVELTVGGGGNSANRLEKIKEKNNKLDVERKEKIEVKKKTIKDKKAQAPKVDLTNVHPDRAKFLR